MSFVFSSFEKIEQKKKNPELYNVICKHCQKCVSGSTKSTTNLWVHLTVSTSIIS